MYKPIIESFKRLTNYESEAIIVFYGGSLFQLASLFSYPREKGLDAEVAFTVICDHTEPPKRRQITKSNTFFLNSGQYIRLNNGENIFLDWTPIREVKEALKQIPKIAKASKRNKDENEQKVLYFFFPYGYEPSTELWNTILEFPGIIKLIRYDEGLGSYVREEAARKVSQDKTRSLTIKKTLMNLYNKILLATLKRLRTKIIIEEDYLLFTKMGKQLAVNRERSLYFKSAFENFYNGTSALTNTLDNYFIIAGTDFSKICNTIEHELKILERTTELIKRLGARVIFKPHPSQDPRYLERYKSVKLEIFDNPELPIEGIISSAKNKPYAVIGLNSTSQVSANAIWEIPSISVYKIFKSEIKHNPDIIDSLQAAIYEHDLLLDLFQEYITAPAHYKELENCLRRAIQQRNQ